MMNSSYEYRAKARQVLQGYWGEAAILSLIVIIATVLCSGGNVYSSFSGSDHFQAFGSITTLLEILVLTPLGFGFSQVILGFYRGKESLDFSGLFRPFREDFPRTVCVGIIMMCLISVASIFTLGILGIYLGCCYAMVPYLLRDYPELTWREVLRTSREMMDGHKWDYFCLQLSFIGWIVLSILTCGLGLLLLMPYMSVAEAAFYDDLKEETIEEIVEDDEIEDAEVVEDAEEVK